MCCILIKLFVYLPDLCFVAAVSACFLTVFKMDDEIICTACKSKEADSSKVLTCMYCFSSVHFKCKKIIGNAVRRMKDIDYFCSPDCSAIYQRIVMMQNSNKTLLSSFADEMKTTISASVAKEIQSVSTEVKQITTTIEKSQEFLSAKFDDILTDFKGLKVENENLKVEVERLKKSQTQLQGTVHKLEANVDKSDKAALTNNVVVWGIPTAQDENMPEIIEKLFLSLGLSDKFETVVSAERIFVSTKNSNALVPIRIVFRDRETKELILNKKKQIGKLISTSIDSTYIINGRSMNVTMRDELTPLSLELMKELRESQDLLNVKFVWAGRGGIVLVKKDENSKPEMVKNREDLSRVMSRFMKSASELELPTASGHSPSPKRKKNTQ